MPGALHCIHVVSATSLFGREFQLRSGGWLQQSEFAYPYGLDDDSSSCSKKCAMPLSCSTRRESRSRLSLGAMMGWMLPLCMCMV